MGHRSLGETHGFPNTCEHLLEFYNISKRSLSGNRSASFLFLGLPGKQFVNVILGGLNSDLHLYMHAVTHQKV